MESLNSLFGGGANTAIQLIFVTLAIVIALLLIFWIFRKISGTGRLAGTRKRQPRLAVTDAAVVDDKRRLILVRRDNVEHLMMIGGPTDVVVEANVQRTQVAATPSTQPIPDPLPVTQMADQQAMPASSTPASTAPVSTATAAVAVGAAGLTAAAAGVSEAASSAGDKITEAGRATADTASAFAEPVAESEPMVQEPPQTMAEPVTPDTTPAFEATPEPMEEIIVEETVVQEPLVEMPVVEETFAEVAIPEAAPVISGQATGDDIEISMDELAEALELDEVEIVADPVESVTPTAVNDPQFSDTQVETPVPDPSHGKPLESDLASSLPSEPAIAPSEPPSPAPVVEEAEDEMARLLRELSGDKPG